MPSLLSDLVKSLTGSREGVLPSAQVFPATDLDQVAAELRLDTRGGEDGRANLPPSDASLEAAAESDVRAEIERRASKALQDYRVQVELYEGRIRRGLLAADLRTSIEAAGERALSDFRVQATDDLSHLDAFRLEAEGRQKEFDAFRSANRLERLPRLPKGVALRWMVVALLVLVEALMNGVFFAEGSETGLIGGVAQATVLSLFNVGVGLCFARYGLPWLRHLNPALKALGTLATAVYVVSTTALNLSIGHFRDLFIQNAGVVLIPDLAARLASGPLNLADARSLILVGLGVAFNVIATVDASGLDDPYPGYGSVGRRKDEAVANYANHRTGCLTDLKARRDEAIADMSQIVADVRTKEHDVQLSVNGRARLDQQYAAYVEHLGNCHVRLVQRYREANLKARTTPSPHGFNVVPVRSVSVETAGPLVALAIDRDAMGHLIDRMEFFIRAISKEYDSQADRYRPVNQLLDAARAGAVDG